MSAVVQSYLDMALEEVTKAVSHCKTHPQTVIARYTAAIAVNFTDWLGKTLPWVRHELAIYTLMDNLRCETEDDHVGMLLRFAEYSDALPSAEHYAHTKHEVWSIRKLFTMARYAGLHGVALCTVLENTSEVFISDLAIRAKECECTDLKYTRVHGEADAKHSEAFVRALDAEMTMGYWMPEIAVSDATRCAVTLIKRIWA